MDPRRFFISVVLILIRAKAVVNDGFTIKNPIHFPGEPGGPFIGLFLAIALPLDLPRYNIFVSYNIEANYNLPTNETEFTYPPVVSKRSIIDRRSIYRMLEKKIEAHGYPGTPCLLRTICEAVEYSLNGHGVLEDIVNVMLLPATSTDENLVEYSKAEKYGKTHGHCKKYRKMCAISILEFMSRKTVI